MTQQREWPNNARAQRDQAAECAIGAIRQLQPLLEGRPLSRTETLRHLARVMFALQRIALLLHAAGAPIRPEAIGE